MANERRGRGDRGSGLVAGIAFIFAFTFVIVHFRFVTLLAIIGVILSVATEGSLDGESIT